MQKPCCVHRNFKSANYIYVADIQTSKHNMEIKLNVF